MENIDNKITEIFWSLIESEVKYIDKIDYISKSIIYNINNTIIKLSINSGIPTPNKFTTCEDIFNIQCWCINTDYQIDLGKDSHFILSINGKYYNVPELSRSEKARVLDKIEGTIKQIEDSTLNNIRNEFLSEEL